MLLGNASRVLTFQYSRHSKRTTAVKILLNWGAIALGLLSFHSQVSNLSDKCEELLSLLNTCLSVFQSVTKNVEFWLHPSPTEPKSLRECWTPTICILFIYLFHHLHFKQRSKRLLFTVNFKNQWLRYKGKCLIKYLGNRWMQALASKQKSLSVGYLLYLGGAGSDPGLVRLLSLWEKSVTGSQPVRIQFCSDFYFILPLS